MDKTTDGVTITEGLHVFTSDCRWGSVTMRAPSYGDGWWYVRADGAPGHTGAAYNGERLATHDYISSR